MATVLVVAAHPDDEILGCGGTIARHAARGDNVSLLFLADGETSRPGAGTADIEKRQAAARKAAEIVGASIFDFADFPDNRLDGVELLTVVRRIEAAIGELAPEIVYTHALADLNIDHQTCHRATLTACRPLPGRSVRRLLAFETLSSTEWSAEAMAVRFCPTLFIDIGDHLAQKLEALDCYDDELPPFPHARSREAVEALARRRGAEVGCPAAEAFQIIREIEGRTGR